ncbi:MAG: EamA family transporter [Candidatus Omnitrophica bacterium]|nr:EamA family transporter [Candidatus Omnitrophota bacterium]
MIVSTDVLETVAQFCFKKTALLQHSVAITSISDVLRFISLAVANPFLWLALFAISVIFCLWITILSKIDLSVAIPVASFSYITIPLVSIIFFGEKIPFLRWIGIGFILLGVVLVSLSSHRQGKEA